MVDECKFHTAHGAMEMKYTSNVFGGVRKGNRERKKVESEMDERIYNPVFFSFFSKRKKKNKKKKHLFAAVKLTNSIHPKGKTDLLHRKSASRQ